MAQQVIDIGTSASDGTGDPLRDAFTKINDNFTELYSGNVQVTGANVLVYSVAGRTGNVVLTVNDVAQAASKSYVDNAIASNLANVTGSVTDSLRANITAANTVISNHESRITVLESNASAQAVSIASLQSTRATIAYVDQSIDLALSSNAILADVASVNANVAAANAAILLRANLTGANFTGNITANSIRGLDSIRAETYFVAGAEALQQLGENWANPAALFFGNSSGQTSRYYQINLQNLDPVGSGDIVVTADDGTDGSNYIVLGINNSQYTDPAYPSGKAHDGYIYVTGGNLGLQSDGGSLDFFVGNVSSPQVSLTQGNILQLFSGVKLAFPDGTIQSTAFGGNANITSINANITAANLAISGLQSNAAAQALDINALYANAGIQASSLSTLTTNAAVQATSIDGLMSNVSTLSSNAAVQSVAISSLQANTAAANLLIAGLTANASTQALELDNLQSNTQVQQSAIIVLQGNSVTQAVAINSLNANVTAANTNITSLTSNATIQAAQINLLNANVAAANVNITTLFANAASQSLDLDNLYANVNYYLANLASSNANIAAANSRIVILDANLGSTSTNVSTLQSNAASQAVAINQLNANVVAANISINNKADLSGAIFSGNVQADYLLANANVKITTGLEVGLASEIDYPGQAGVFVGDVDGYYQLVLQNINSGPQASGDIVITADDGTDSDNYINIGINSSGWSGNFTVPAGDTGLPEFPHDGYFNVIGGNVGVRSDESVFLVANTAVAALFKDGGFFINNNLTVVNTITTQGNLAASNINVTGQINYVMGNALHWNPPVSNVSAALDQIAARLYALENL
jgi:uncharacterized coiled-coil protein SlyX